MSLGRNKLYSILLVACVAGYLWLLYSVSTSQSGSSDVNEVCLIKHVTNIPCPSCGSTRSVLSLLDGNLVEAITINPFGIIIALIMVILPPWILFDFAAKRKTFFEFYGHAEVFLRSRNIAIPLLILVLVNWAWNITKGL